MLDIDLGELIKNIDKDNISEVEEPNGKDIAIIGISVKLPVAENTNEFWSCLSEGKDCISEFPSARRKAADKYLKYMGYDLKQIGYKRGAYLDSIEEFDCKFFNISPKEANLMDPNQRMFLECTYKAIEDAGYGGNRLKGSRTGVYLGFVSLLAYQRYISDVEPASAGDCIIGNLASIIPARISYILDLKGPSLVIDTACSSSLAAVHTACRAIINGDCDMAIAGSVKVNLLPMEDGFKLGIESDSCTTRAFDDEADGTVMGEGTAVIVLKGLSKAIKDKDNIYAVIKGSAINQDGTSIGITAPNSPAQAEVIEKAWKDADVAPETIRYIETHGTGTKLGDPIEADGISRAFSKYTDKKQFCGIGSLKTNLGHLDCASGIVSLIKAVLILKNRQIPPSLHFNKPNRNIEFENSPFYINDRLQPLEPGGSPGRCGVSAFGLSGTNCHVVLEEAPAISGTESSKGLQVFALSAKSQTAMTALIEEYIEFINNNNGISLVELCYTASTGRGHYNLRIAVTANSLEELKERLETLIKAGIKENLSCGLFCGGFKVSADPGTAEKTGVITEAEHKEMSEEAKSIIKEYESWNENTSLLKDICTLYVKGAEINWDDFYKKTVCRRISLPTYPFDRKRCWVDVPEGTSRRKMDCLSISEDGNGYEAGRTALLTGREGKEYSAAEKQAAQILGLVLGYDEINISDNFYELGGDSISAMKAVNNINSSIGCKIELKDLLASATIGEFIGLLDKKASKPGERDYIVIKSAESKDYYPLSSSQRRLFFLSGMEGIGVSYNMPAMLKVEGKLDKEKIDRVFKAIVMRHETLRTSFELVGEEPVQRVHQSVEFEVNYISATDNESESLIRDFIKQFDLGKAPLLRVEIASFSKDSHILMLDMHHIISDGTSIGILIKEFVSIYEGLELQPLKLQYKDYSVWQAELMKSELMKKQEEFWLREFREEPQLPDLPLDYPRPAIKSYEGDCVTFSLNRELSRKLYDKAAEISSSLYVVLLSAYNVLLYKYTGQTDIVVGMPISGRINSDIEGLIGMFVNTLAIRCFPDGKETFNTFAEKVKGTVLKAYDNQDYQLDALIDKLKLKRDLSRDPLFGTNLVLQNMDMPEVELKGLKLTSGGIESKVARYDLSVFVLEKENGLELNMEYCTRLFKRETILRFAQHFANIISNALDNPNEVLSQIGMLSEEEKQQILLGFNDTKAAYASDKTIKELFEEQAETTPENTAVVFGGRSLSYKELNIKANKLARLLKDKGVERDKPVGIMTERSAEMIIGVLGVIKAGGAYLPIDLEYPESRIKFMLEDSGAGVLLTQSTVDREKLSDDLKNRLVIINLDDESNYCRNALNLETVNCPDDLAYVIYTSGSTGKPKGVQVPHRGISNFRTFFKDKLDINENDRILQFASFSFDASVWNTFMALLHGAALYVPTAGIVANYVLLENYISKNNISVATLPPTYLAYMQPESVKTLRMLMSGGSAISIDQADRWVLGLRLINIYGPTEATIVATYIEYKQNAYSTSVPIGKPVSNASIYILGENDFLQPVGVVGEICIGGVIVSRGYLNRPELNSEKFVPNPFAEGTRMYRTGDLGRWLPDGNIEYFGRNDNQVKIRGFRIEIGEIEAAMLSYPLITNAIVTARVSGNRESFLCGYFTANERVELSMVKKFIEDRLPSYMVPAYLIQIEKMPLTLNGKIDLKALPEPAGSLMQKEPAAPENETERRLQAIWKEILDTGAVGINDNFFELGGHSLKLASMAVRINKEFGVQLPLSVAFAKPTIKEIGRYLLKSGGSSFEGIAPAVKKEHYVLSSAQKRVFILNRFDEIGTGYNICAALEIEGRLDRNSIEKTFRRLINRHETLRTVFELSEGEPVQRILAVADFTVDFRKAVYNQVPTIIKEFVRPFDLSHAPLLRVCLTEITGTNKHVMLLDMHHIISDGVSIGILIRDFLSLYKGQQLDELTLQYKDYAEWQNGISQTEAVRRQGEYWERRFSGELPVLNLPYDFPRPANQSFEGCTINCGIEHRTAEGLKKLAAATDTTLFMVLLAAYNVLLYKYTGQEDIIVGTPVSGRTHADVENILGMFVNTLPMRNYPEASKGFRDFLEEVRVNSINAFENQDYQLGQLLDKLLVKRDLSRNPLFDTMFSLQNTGAEVTEVPGIKVREYGFDAGISKFDLTVTAVEKQNELWLNFEYCTGLFRRETVEKLAGHFINILEAITVQPDRKLSEIKMLSEHEIKHMLCISNGTAAEYPKHKRIHQIFEEQAEKTPNSTAVIFDGQRMTYGGLNGQCNRLARSLREKGVQRDSIVGIISDRSFEMIIGIMAVLKAGGAYLPVSPSYPQERIKYMLEDSGAKTLLVQNSAAASRLEDIEQEICILKLDDSSIYNQDAANLENINQPNDLAYIIYTSGSTGKPKGTMIEHHSVINRLNWMQKKYPIGEGDIILQKTPYTFDVSVWELFWWSFNGAGLCMLAPGGEKEPGLIAEAVEKNKVTTMHFVPSMLNIFMEYLELEGKVQRLKTLRQVFASGEALTPQQAESFNRLINKPLGTTLHNLYGPTEATVDVSCFDCPSGQKLDTVPIGKPIDNIRLYVLDKNNRLQPAGVPGELHIAGVGLARGYINRPELTKEKFISDPFIPEERMYKTGDLARWMPDGNLEYLGRIDHQVKIRGFRIELGEIENCLQKHPSVKEAAAAAREDKEGNKYLCAYMVSDTQLSVSEIREYLARELPEYMVPSYFIQIEKIPLSPNGKADRKALPEPEGKLFENTEYTAPGNATERQLAEIWHELLMSERIGINNSFFELGGDSLKAMKLAYRVRKTFGTELSIKAIFENQTVKQLSKLINIMGGGIVSSIPPAEIKDYYEVTPAQRRLFFLDQLEAESTTYNLPAVIALEGKLEVKKFEEVFGKLVQRHEALRTSFDIVEDKPVQIIHQKAELELVYETLPEISAAELVRSFVRPFALHEAPLIRVKLVKQSENRHLLIYDMHHIISDGISINILTREFIALYSGVQLPELRIQYKDYSVWMKEQLVLGLAEKQEKYWLDRFGGKLPVLGIPVDYPRPEILTFEGNTSRILLDKEMSSQLAGLAAETGTTLYSVLLSALNILLSLYSGQEDIIIGSPVAGRTHADLEEAIGMFVNTVAMRNFPEGGKSYRKFLQEVMDNSLKAFENQDYQLDELIGRLALPRELSRNPLFDVVFVMQKSDVMSTEIDGLKFIPVQIGANTAKFDLTLQAEETQEGLLLGFEYSTRLFMVETIEKLQRDMKKILDIIVKNRDVKINEILLEGAYRKSKRAITRDAEFDF